MDNPLVSIMMPVYNGLPLIKASIKSILLQTYSNWECIIIDDGSTDGTSEFLDSINDERFVIVHQANYGRPVARQKALDLAKGKYIAMLDAEDLYHPDKIRKQVEILESNLDISLVTTAMCSFGTKTNTLIVRGPERTDSVIYTGTNHPSHAPSLLRASVAKQCKYNPILKLGEDQDFLEKYLNIGGSFVKIADVYYYYSEFDSVTKSKIRRSYYLHIPKYFKEHNYRRMIIYFLKYMYSLVVFPFITIEHILSKRGRLPNATQHAEFEKYCLSLIREIYSEKPLTSNEVELDKVE